MKKLLIAMFVLVLGLTICGCDLLDDTGNGPMQSADIRIINSSSEPVVFWLGGSKTNSTATTKMEIFAGNMNVRLNTDTANLQTVISIGTQIGGNSRQYRVPVKLPNTINSGMIIKITLVYSESGFRVASVS